MSLDRVGLLGTSGREDLSNTNLRQEALDVLIQSACMLLHSLPGERTEHVLHIYIHNYTCTRVCTIYIHIMLYADMYNHRHIANINITYELFTCLSIYHVLCLSVCLSM